MRALDEPDGSFANAQLAAPNINPGTGLASDYLNHFNEAIMLLELLLSYPECIHDFLAWKPMSYRNHFAASRLTGRDIAIAAYDAADPRLRRSMDALASRMNAVLEATRVAISANLPPEQTAALAERAVACLRPLVARAGAVINGETDGTFVAAPQAVVDGLMKR